MHAHTLSHSPAQAYMYDILLAVFLCRLSVSSSNPQDWSDTNPRLLFVICSTKPINQERQIYSDWIALYDKSDTNQTFSSHHLGLGSSQVQPGRVALKRKDRNIEGEETKKQTLYYSIERQKTNNPHLAHLKYWKTYNFEVNEQQRYQTGGF